MFLKDTEIGEAVAGQLRQVGIRVKLVPTERAKIQKDAQENTFQGITSVAWGTQFEPDVMLNWVMMRAAHDHPAHPGAGAAGARARCDLEKRRKIYQELYRVAHDEAMWLFVHAQDELWAKRRDVSWLPYSITGQQGDRVLLPGARCPLSGGASARGNAPRWARARRTSTTG